jgi:hypothetical protein
MLLLSFCILNTEISLKSYCLATEESTIINNLKLVEKKDCTRGKLYEATEANYSSLKCFEELMFCNLSYRDLDSVDR